MRGIGRKVVTLDIPERVVRGLEDRGCMERGRILRLFLENGVTGCYDRKGRHRDIHIRPGVLSGDKTRVGLTVVDTTLEMLDDICDGTPFTRKSLAEYLITTGYEKWIN